MDLPTAVILAGAAGLALKCLADLAARHREAERERIARENALKAEARPGLGVTGESDAPPAPKLAP